MEMRLQKFMADKGIASRRKSEELILEGKVSVNGEIVKSLGMKIDSEKDYITYNGAPVSNLKPILAYYALNKPKNYVSTAKDQFDRPCVTEIIDSPHRLYPVGRLDYDTTGLLILTNDGDLTYKLTHPKHSIPKAYLARVKGVVSKESLETLKNGVDIGDYITRPAKVEIIKTDKNSTTLKIEIREGKNRQVRKMCTGVGHDVLSLKRISMGNIELGNISVGEYRQLTQGEIEYLKSL